MSSSPADAAAGPPRPSAAAGLRRIDWRFLTGRPLPDRVAHAGAPDLAAALGAMGADVVALADADRVPLAVLADPANATIARAAQVVEPGGACYVEWSRRRPGAARRLRRRLEAAGFTDVESYAVWPPPRRRQPAYWLPHGNPHAVAAFLASRPRPRTRRGRAFLGVARRAWMAAHRAEIAVPIAVIASRPGGEGSTLAARLRGSWERSGLGAAPARVDLIVLTGGRSDENKIVVLVVADGEEHPRFVVKLPRIERAREGLEREARSLAEVAGTHVPDLATVPRIVLRDEMDGVPFIGETLVEGEPLQATLRAASFPATAAAVADVLAAMVPAMVPAAVADPADIRQRLVEPVIEGFRARFGAVARATEIAAAESCIRALPPLPAVPEQRDCSPWNLLWTGDGRLAILDWESAEPQGLPVLDLCYFLAHAAFLLDGTLGSAREHETYRDLIAGRGPWAPTFRAALDRYCGQVGIDAPTERALRVLGWMIHANVEVDRTGCEAGASVFLSLWRAETEPAR